MMRLLMLRSRFSFCLRTKGNFVKLIASESRARIEVLPLGQHPQCVPAVDEVIHVLCMAVKYVTLSNLLNCIVDCLLQFRDVFS
uniref:Uncharacterized protein n=1 Tax=Kalanchoe fedtschenkoi TaxID=63787 RepID=A0A7N0V346_KALFE